VKAAGGDDKELGVPPIPYIGEWRPKGFTLQRTLTVAQVPNDRTCGRMTVPELIAQLKVGSAYAIVGSPGFVHRVGEFSVE